MPTIHYAGKLREVHGSFKSINCLNYLITHGSGYAVISAVDSNHPEKFTTMWKSPKRLLCYPIIAIGMGMTERAVGDLYTNSDFIRVIRTVTGFLISHKKYNASPICITWSNDDLVGAVCNYMATARQDEIKVLNRFLSDYLMIDSRYGSNQINPIDSNEERMMKSSDTKEKKQKVEVEFEISNDLFVADQDIEKIMSAFGDELRTRDMPLFYEASYDLTSGLGGLKNYFIVLNPVLTQSIMQSISTINPIWRTEDTFGSIPRFQPHHGFQSGYAMRASNTIDSLIINAVLDDYDSDVVIVGWSDVPIFGTKKMVDFSKELTADTWYGRE